MEALLRNVKTNIVQSIRAFNVTQLQQAAQQLGHHFLYANLGRAQSKQDVLDLIVQQYTLPAEMGSNYDALYDCMTDIVHKSGPQVGFIVVLEHIPANGKFDREAREQLLDIFRDTADFWSEKKVPFRCFYSYSVACSTKDKEKDKDKDKDKESHRIESTSLDISPIALRMSSPFNAAHWVDTDATAAA